jgi:ubiquinone/menaquinone biosynthesis C-methylase UbiE
VAKARNAIAVKNGRVELRHGSVEDLPFAGDTFHKAMAINSMQIWPDAIAGLREMRVETEQSRGRDKGSCPPQPHR